MFKRQCLLYRVHARTLATLRSLQMQLSLCQSPGLRPSDFDALLIISPAPLCAHTVGPAQLPTMMHGYDGCCQPWITSR